MTYLTMLRHCAGVVSGALAFWLVASGDVFAVEPGGETGMRLSSQTEQITEMDPVSWVKPKAILGPEYPKQALEQKITGVVDVEVVVNEFGGLQEVRSIKSQPKNDAFESAVRAVVEEWVFEVPRLRCAPSSTAGNLRVWFNIKNGEAVVSISYPQPLREEMGDVKVERVVALNFDAVKRSMAYPRGAKKAGAQADVYVEAHVDPKSGAITKTDAVKIYAHPTFEGAFALEAKQGAAELVFTPMPTRDKPVIVCVPFSFRLRD